MVDDDCAIRAPAATEREEIQLLRGAVAALRATRADAVACARADARTAPARARLALPTLVAFLLGVAVTSATIAMFSAALCP